MARKTTQITVTVYHVKRGRVSAMGNPGYVFVTDHGEYKTETDSGRAYALENDFSVGATLDAPVTLELTAGGRVRDWTIAPKTEG